MARDNRTSKTTHNALNAHVALFYKLVYWNGRVRLPKCIVNANTKHTESGFTNQMHENGRENKNCRKQKSKLDTDKTMIQVALFG